MMLDHEGLDVYQLSRKLNRQVAALVPQVTPGQHESVDNLRRAVKSVSRNLAEGAGRWSTADKMHRYHISRGSATEASASLDELVDFGLASEDSIQPAKQTIVRIVSMLIKMIRSTEAKGADMSGRPKIKKGAAGFRN